MGNVFLISDTHFGHQGVCEFLTNEGTKLRPWATAAEMDEVMVERWNSVVKDGDKVYHLGDVAMSKRGMEIMWKLNGRKCLIKGNHDREKLKEYMKWFYDIRASHLLDKLVLSHIPLHPNQFERFGGNVHGHLHSNLVLDSEGKPDKRYMSLCVEQIDYTPVEFSVVQKYFHNSK